MPIHLLFTPELYFNYDNIIYEIINKFTKTFNLISVMKDIIVPLLVEEV